MEKEKYYDELNWQRESIADTLSLMCDELTPIAKSIDGHKNLQEIIQKGLKKINSLNDSIKEPFKIAVVGAQGTGKSTIINVLLGEQVMISHYDETEGGIIKLVFTEDPELEKKACIKYFTDKEGIYKEEIISRSDFLRLINLSTNGKLKTDSVYRDSIAFFEIYSCNQLLRNVQFVNTPGMNTITADFLKKVRHLFIEADMIIWMTKRNQILDAFNTSLIPQIHMDNKNIIGVLGFADDLYQMDRVNGFNNVLEEFFSDIEKKMLLRKVSAGEDRVCFFIYNGLAAESALGMKDAVLIEDRSSPYPAEEAGLRMLWNYKDHGFPFSDEGTAVIDKFSLWNEYNKGMNTDKVTEIYERNDFINWLHECGFFKTEGDKCIFTETGQSLLLESSLLLYIEQFAQEHIFGNKLDEKVTRVKEGFDNLYGDHNILGDIKKIKKDYEKTLEEEGKNAAETRKYIEALKTTFRKDYREWCLTRMQRYSNRMSKLLVDKIIGEINEKVGKKDFGKELFNMMKPKMFRGDDDSPVAEIVSEIIETAFEDIIGEKTEDIIGEALEEAKNIIFNLTTVSLNGEGIKGM